MNGQAPEHHHYIIFLYFGTFPPKDTEEVGLYMALKTGLLTSWLTQRPQSVYCRSLEMFDAVAQHTIN